MADQWYYTENRERRGPMSEEQLKEIAASAKLKPTDLVWKKGMASWVPAAEIEGLIPKPAEDEPPPIPPEDEPPPIPAEALPPPVPWTHRARGSLDYILHSPLTLIGIALIVSACLPFLLCLHFSVAGILGLLQNGFILAAAVLTIQKKDYRIAIVVSLFVLFGWVWMPAGILKCISAVIALPIGVWSFLALRKPELRQQFLNQDDPVAPVAQWVVAKFGLQATPQNDSRVTLASMGGGYALAVIFAMLVGHSSTSTSAQDEQSPQASSRIVGTWTKDDSHSLRFTSGGSVVMAYKGSQKVMKYSLTNNSLTFLVAARALGEALGGIYATEAAPAKRMDTDESPPPAPIKEPPKPKDEVVFYIEFTSVDEMVLGEPSHSDAKALAGIWRRQKDDKGVTAANSESPKTRTEPTTETKPAREAGSTGNNIGLAVLGFLLLAAFSTAVAFLGVRRFKPGPMTTNRIALVGGFSVAVAIPLALLFMLFRAAFSSTDLERIQGTWNVIAGSLDGTTESNPDPTKLRVIFKGNTFTFLDKHPRSESKITLFVLRPSTKPKGIDLVPPPGMEDKPTLGIYDLAKDDLTVCLGENGGERPKAFGERNAVILILKRAKNE